MKKDAAKIVSGGVKLRLLVNKFEHDSKIEYGDEYYDNGAQPVTEGRYGRETVERQGVEVTYWCPMVKGNEN